MDSEKKAQVLEVLEYWKTIEFLGQTGINAQSNESKKLLRRIVEKGEKPKRKKLEIFHYLDDDLKFDVKEMLKADSKTFGFLPAVGEDCFFCMGKVLRNDLVDYLAKYVPNRDELPELAYGEKDAIAWFSFKSDTKGEYKEYSFRLSPLLWAVKVWEDRDAAGSRDFSFDMKQYEADSRKIVEMLKEYEEDYGEINTADFLEKIYNHIFNEYVDPYLPSAREKQRHIGFCEYNRYISEAEKSKDKTPDDYSDMGRSFYLDDLDRLEKEIANDSFGDNSEFERSVVNFILSAGMKCSGTDAVRRTMISPNESPQNSFSFFSKVLDIKKAPNGKWPALFMPSLMQQTAVNLAIDKNGHTPVFSVNGPPGTGKTTLLKEVLADCIVERAFLIASKAGDDPDSAFEECHFKRGPLEKYNNAYVASAPNYYKLKYDEINDYGILVTSCNNSAVENITLDLPKSGDVLENLDPSKVSDENVKKALELEDESVKKGLEEVYDLFDAAQSDDIESVEVFDKESGKNVLKTVHDIFFTRYADNLLPKVGCWGLISAPLGRRENIKDYCSAVLSPFIKDYASQEIRAEHLEKYRKQRDIFLKQYKYVQQLKAELAEVCSDCAAHTDTFELPEKYTAGENKMSVIDKEFVRKYSSENEEESTDAQLSNPWATAKFNREREKLFFYACRLHKEFAASSDAIRQNALNLMAAWNLCDEASGKMAYDDRFEAVPVLLQSLFLITPVISTTFASVQNFLRDVQRSGVIGMLIVDEAGQAQPQESIGALYRCRKAIIVGDPKQIEPVVTAETDMFKQMLSSELLKGYKDKKVSVQGFADYINPYGTYLGQGTEREWVGCPLVVHRRCADPMYSVSNQLSYDNTMKNQKKTPKNNSNYILPKSCWINVSGVEEGSGKHYVKAQGEIVLKLLETAFKKNEKLPALYIITPFTSVKDGIASEIQNSQLYKSEPRVKDWLKGKNIGTVHTFQGKGTDEVIFLLGCDGKSTSAANWVNKNIVNVAATRAKQRFYMIGDAAVWKGCKPVMTAKQITNNDLTAAELEQLLSGKAAEPSISASHEPEAAPTVCPECGKPLKERNGQFGKFMGCTGFPKCNYTYKPKTKSVQNNSAQAADPAAPTVCPKCGKPLKERNGRFGKFMGCSGYPDCNYIYDPKAKSAQNNSSQTAAPAAAKQAPTVCPECGKPLKERNGRFGKFMGCSGYPKCNYTYPPKKTVK